MRTALRSLALLPCCLAPLSAQAGMQGNMAWQMQQQQQQAQRMFQMQQQLQRTMQMQQMQQQQMRMQMQQQATAQARQAQQKVLTDLAQSRTPMVAPPTLERPAKVAWTKELQGGWGFPAFDGLHAAAVMKGPWRLMGLSLGTGAGLWSAALPGEPAVDPCYAGDSLVAVTKDLQVVAVDAETGKERARLALDKLDGYVMGAKGAHARVFLPAVQGARMVMATYGKGPNGPTGWIYAYDTTAWTLVWKQPFEGGPDFAPQIQDGKVLVAGCGRVAALDLEKGTQAWECRISGDSAVSGGQLLPGQMLVVCDKRLLAIRTTDGAIAWNLPHKSWMPPMGEGGRVLVTEFRGLIKVDPWLVALDAATGRKLWEQVRPGLRMPWIQDGRVFCDGKGGVAALDASTGATLWTFAMPEGVSAPPMVAGEAAYVLGPAGKASRLTALKLQDGTKAWEFGLPAAPAEPMVLPGCKGFLVVGTVFEPELVYAE